VLSVGRIATIGAPYDIVFLDESEAADHAILRRRIDGFRLYTPPFLGSLIDPVLSLFFDCVQQSRAAIGAENCIR
jgi:hypothetical protein